MKKQKKNFKKVDSKNWDLYQLAPLFDLNNYDIKLIGFNEEVVTPAEFNKQLLDYIDSIPAVIN